MSKTKILTIYPTDLETKIGGIESFIKASVEYAPSDFEIEIVGISLKNRELKIGKWHDLIFDRKKIKFFPVLKVKDSNIRPLIPLTLQFALALFRWRHKIEFRNRLLIFHRIEPAFVLKDVTEKKILFVHGDISYFDSPYCESKWRRIRNLYYFIEPFFITEMEKIFVVSHGGTEYYKKRYNKHSKKFEFFPSFYDSKVFHIVEILDKQELLRSYRIPDKKLIILWVGRLELPKAPYLLLDTFYLINKRYPESKLVIVGDGTLRRKIIEKSNNLNLSDKVSFFGSKSPIEIAQLMNIADLFLLTSDFEGMPCVVLEALACGLPVVATNAGEIPLVVKDGISGKVISSRNPEDIAKAVFDVNTSPPSASSCQEAVVNYSNDKVLSFFYEELRKICNG